jgi:HpcH/HpaI aldolase/citrate lyase family
MRVNAAKQQMLQGKSAFGYALGLGSPLVAGALSRCGIDFVMVDNQHGSYSAESTLASLIAAEGGSATPMARVARNDYTMIGRLLDEGMLGIVVPMVHTVEEARAVATACRFPPHGTRSWGWSHAGVYGLITRTGSTSRSSWPFRSRAFRPSRMPRRSWRSPASTASLANLAISLFQSQPSVPRAADTHAQRQASVGQHLERQVELVPADWPALDEQALASLQHFCQPGQKLAQARRRRPGVNGNLDRVKLRHVAEHVDDVGAARVDVDE